jgi:hypothetical protein
MTATSWAVTRAPPARVASASAGPESARARRARSARASARCGGRRDLQPDGRRLQRPRRRRDRLHAGVQRRPDRVLLLRASRERAASALAVPGLRIVPGRSVRRVHGRGPSRVEVCNNVDDDCDGTVDEGLDCTPPDSRTPAVRLAAAIPALLAGGACMPQGQVGSLGTLGTGARYCVQKCRSRLQSRLPAQPRPRPHRCERARAGPPQCRRADGRHLTRRDPGQDHRYRDSAATCRCRCRTRADVDVSYAFDAASGRYRVTAVDTVHDFVMADPNLGPSCGPSPTSRDSRSSSPQRPKHRARRPHVGPGGPGVLIEGVPRRYIK